MIRALALGTALLFAGEAWADESGLMISYQSDPPMCPTGYVFLPSSAACHPIRLDYFEHEQEKRAATKGDIDAINKRLDEIEKTVTRMCIAAYSNFYCSSR